MVFDRLRKIDESIRRTRSTWFGQVTQLFDRRAIDEALWDELEELLIRADVGVSTTEKLLERVKERVRREHLVEAEGVKQVLTDEMIRLLDVGDRSLHLPRGEMAVVLAVGVNGSGKTTTVAKVAQYLRQQDRRVLMAAGDTFRAAAIDQLEIWGQRTGIDVIAHQPGADAAAVVFDAMQAARRRGVDVLLVDTAGRLQTKFNLMEELRKVRRVVNREDPKAPHEVLLVLDATTGQNALSQARYFTEAVNVTGLVIAKLDGTAKGGSVFAIADELKIPIKFIGTGEKLDDVAEFDPTEFVKALLAG